MWMLLYASPANAGELRVGTETRPAHLYRFKLGVVTNMTNIWQISDKYLTNICKILKCFSVFSVLYQMFLFSSLLFVFRLYLFSFSYMRLSRSQYETINNAPQIRIQHWSVCMCVNHSTLLKESVSMKADCCVASRRLCLSQTVAPEHTAKDTADRQLACSYARGNNSPNHQLAVMPLIEW